MAHLQPQITEKMRGWKVETRDAGTCYVPGDVVSVPYILGTDQPLQRADDPDLFEMLFKRLRDYVEGRDFDYIEVIHCRFARLSAPGYLDCTEWTAHYTLRAARSYLKEMSE